jgi:hypothetical protein
MILSLQMADIKYSQNLFNILTRTNNRIVNTLPLNMVDHFKVSKPTKLVADSSNTL